MKTLRERIRGSESDRVPAMRRSNLKLERTFMLRGRSSDLVEQLPSALRYSVLGADKGEFFRQKKGRRYNNSCGLFFPLN
jgi:hypothetical protein